MHICRVMVHNFRSILHQSFNAYNYMLLVGSNNSGKTTIIDCIRAFYEKDKYVYDEKRDFPKMSTEDDESWIEIAYELTATEQQNLESIYLQPHGQFVVRKYFKTKITLEEGKPAKGSILPLLSDGNLSLKPYCSISEIQKGKLGTLIYVPAANRVEDYDKLSGPSAMRDLITSIMADVLEGSPIYDALKESVLSFGKDIMKTETEEGKSLEGFRTEMNQALLPWGVSFSLLFTAPSVSDIIKNMLGTEMWDNMLGVNQGIENFGSGLQRHYIFSLIKVGSSYIKQQAKGGSGFQPVLNLLLFEEPEAFLHPSQQLSLADDLKKLAKSEGWQIVSSSHSPHFISQSVSSLVSLVHLQRQQSITKIYQLSSEDIVEITEKNHALHDIALRWPNLAQQMTDNEFCQDMDAIKYFMYFNAERAGAFFSNHVLLVEGPSEVALINKLRDSGRLELPSSAYIMDCIGKHNIHRFMNLFGKLGISHSVIFDDDDDKQEHRDINQLIEVDSRNEFTCSVARIPINLEAFLGVPKCRSNNKKPQNILYNLEKGNIAEEKIAQFVGIVVGAWESH